MLPEHRDDLDALDADYWWFRVRFEVTWRLIETVAPRPRFLLDVGCGSGGFIRSLIERRRLPPSCVLGVESSDEALATLARRGVPAVKADGPGLRDLRLPQPPDAITLLDVIEHVAEPVPMLAALRELALPGAYLFVLVPAHMSLWSRWDEAVGHHRRYDRRRLTAELSAAGWSPVRTGHLFSALALPALLRNRLFGWRTLSHVRFPRVPAAVNRLLYDYFRIEARLPWLPTGTSLYAVARNPVRRGAPGA